MPYRTAPEKPVEIVVKLTAAELVEAVRLYAEDTLVDFVSEDEFPRWTVEHVKVEGDDSYIQVTFKPAIKEK